MLWFRPLPPLFIAGAAFLAACSPTTDLRPTVTLLVTNATCATGECLSLEVRGFIPKFTVPGQPPGGFLVLGRVDGTSACLTFPPAFSLTVTGPADPTTITWTVADPVSLTALDGGGPFSIVGSTAEFVPSTAPGWSVTFPTGAGVPGLAATSSCSP